MPNEFCFWFDYQSWVVLGHDRGTRSRQGVCHGTETALGFSRSSIHRDRFFSLFFSVFLWTNDCGAVRFLSQSRLISESSRPPGLTPINTHSFLPIFVCFFLRPAFFCGINISEILGNDIVMYLVEFNVKLLFKWLRLAEVNIFLIFFQMKTTGAWCFGLPCTLQKRCVTFL